MILGGQPCFAVVGEMNFQGLPGMFIQRAAGNS